MDLDDKVCLCFHVTRRKLVNYVRIHQPKVASQLSQCGGAGTGCGWCVPFLKQIFRQGTSESDRGQESGVRSQEEPAELEVVSAEEYAKRRADYVRSGKGTPPLGAMPLPDDSGA
jgi:NAD(P)H-nitrite reductase large subunit